MSPAREAILGGRAHHRREVGDLLVLRGADGPDLLHRLSASEVRGARPGEVRTLLFTDDRGRVVGAPVARFETSGVWLLAEHGRGVALQAWLERWIITEDARVERVDDRVVFDLHGAEATGVAAERCGVALPPPGQSTETEGRTLWRTEAALQGDAHLVVDGTTSDAAQRALESELEAVDLVALRIHAIESGRVWPGTALETTPNPLEIGWKHLISFTKGCYIGQEVVARLDTYDKVRRHVAVLDLPIEARAGSVVRAAERRIGVVLDAVPHGQRALGLAVVDRDIGEGRELELENAGAGTLLRIPAPTTDFPDDAGT